MENYVFAMIGAVGTGCSILFAAIGYQRGLKKDTKQDGQDDGALKSDMQYIKRRIDDVLLEQREINKSINNINERLTRAEESLKQAHKRLDHAEGRC